MTAAAPHVDAATAERVLTRAMALDAAREAARLAAKGTIERSRLRMQFEDGWLRVFAAALPDRDLVGYKEFRAVFARNLPIYTCHLFRISTGEPLGVVDAYRITRLRTAASAALAVAHVMGARPLRVGVLGSGSEAREGLAALAEIVTVTEASVFSPRPESRASFAADLSAALGIEVRPAASASACTSGADLVYGATNSGGRVVATAEDLRGVAMLATIGSTLPSQREIEGRAFAGATPLVVDTLDAFDESGDLLDAAAGGHAGRGDAVLLGAFLDQPASPPDGHDGMVVYKSIGSAEQDLVLAAEVLRAVRDGGG